MKVLLDENIPHELRFHLPGDDIFTVQYMGWSGLKNGTLMRQAAEAGFKVIITFDRGLGHQKPADVDIRIVLVKAGERNIHGLLGVLEDLIHGMTLGMSSDSMEIR